MKQRSSSLKNISKTGRFLNADERERGVEREKKKI